MSPTVLPASDNARIDTSVARGAAVLFVTNSHLESFYPVSWLADGGLIGLTLFFCISGFGLGKSSNTRQQSFFPWYRRRLTRIYPALWITLLILPVMWMGHWQDWTWRDYITQALYPTQYQFIAKIVVYYWVVFWAVRPGCPLTRSQLVVLSVCVSLLAALPDILRLAGEPTILRTGQLNQFFLWQVFLTTTLLGVWLAENDNWLRRPLRWADAWQSMLLAGAYVATKLAMSRYGILPQAFVVYFAIGIALSLYILRILSQPVERSIGRWLLGIWPALGVIGSISLEMYLVHIQLYQWEFWQRFAFPLNILTFGLCSLLIAAVVHRIIGMLQFR